MFELEKTPAKLASVNARAEIHGEKRVPAFDLKFEIEADNGILAHFAPDLRSALYKRPEDQQDMIDPERLSVLKYPGMSGFKWDLDGKGYTLVVPYGIGGPGGSVTIHRGPARSTRQAYGSRSRTAAASPKLERPMRLLSFQLAVPRLRLGIELGRHVGLGVEQPVTKRLVDANAADLFQTRPRGRTPVLLGQVKREHDASTSPFIDVEARWNPVVSVHHMDCEATNIAVNIERELIPVSVERGLQHAVPINFSRIVP